MKVWNGSMRKKSKPAVALSAAAMPASQEPPRDNTRLGGTVPAAHLLAGSSPTSNDAAGFMGRSGCTFVRNARRGAGSRRRATRTPGRG